MAFRLIKDPMDTQAEEFPISSQTVSVGEVLELDIGAANWTTGDASTTHWQRKAVAMEAATSSATVVKAILVNNYQLWEVDTANDGAAADNGDRMLLGSGGLTVNNTGTDNTTKEACFVQKAPVGDSGDNTIIGWIIAGTGVNPDAT